MDVKIKFGIIAFFIIVFQTILKVLGIVITGSLSFLSESVDTFVDIFFVSITLYAIITSQKPADYEHMYGHTKIDSIGSLVQGVVLINLYIFIIFNAVQVMITASFSISSPNIGILLIIISFVINIIFSRILVWQGRKHKSLSLEIQGLNLFQDSLRALVVLLSFILSLFGIVFLDPIFSIALSIWIVISALQLTRKGLKDLADENPINALIIEKLRIYAFNLEHVNGVEDIRVRSSGSKLFLEIRLSVEDHISVVHANEITRSIRTLSNSLIPFYDVECIIEMNPLGGERSVGENLINLIYSIYSDHARKLNIKDVDVFRIKNDFFLSLNLIVDNSLSLEEAHDICTTFENEIKNQAENLSRIITHIESSSTLNIIMPKELTCDPVDDEMKVKIQKTTENILRNNGKVRGYHGLEFWTAKDYYLLEIHVYFDKTSNIADVHDQVSKLEEDIKKKLKINNLKEVILHSEPFRENKKGIIF